jgi:hypothetical protein
VTSTRSRAWSSSRRSRTRTGTRSDSPSASRGCPAKRGLSQAFRAATGLDTGDSPLRGQPRDSPFPRLFR